jgi:serine/threonine protein kinase
MASKNEENRSHTPSDSPEEVEHDMSNKEDAADDTIDCDEVDVMDDEDFDILTSTVEINGYEWPAYMADDTESAGFWRENSHMYRHGGFHPVVLGDFLGDDNRYKVIFKLGHGGYSVVWGCRDTVDNKYVAIKLQAAILSKDNCQDVTIQDLLLGGDEANRDALEAAHIILPASHFWIDGPNGRHLALVLPLLGPSIEDMWRWHGDSPAWRKKVVRQLVESVAYLHGHGVVHGDFRPDNILTRVNPELHELAEDDLLLLMGGGFDAEGFPLREGEDEDAEPGPHEPKYLCVGKNLYRVPDEYLYVDEIAVVDFGVAFSEDTPPDDDAIPLEYRAPEGWLDISDQPGKPVDLWALACTIVKVLTGGEAFQMGLFGPSVRNFMTQLEYIMGPMPEPYREAWRAAGHKKLLSCDEEAPQDDEMLDGALSKLLSMSVELFQERRQGHLEQYGTEDAVLAYVIREQKPRRPTKFTLDKAKESYQAFADHQESDGQKSDEATSTEHDEAIWTMEWVYSDVAPYKISLEEAQHIRDLLVKLFRWIPGDRVSAEELLEDPWFLEAKAEIKNDTKASENKVPPATEEEKVKLWALSRVLIKPVSAFMKRMRGPRQ